MSFALLWLVAAAAAAYGGPRAPYEVVRDHAAISVEVDGSFTETREETYLALDAAGVRLLRERKLFYSRGFETLTVVAAATLKADGRRLDIPAAAILTDRGQSLPRGGFLDVSIVSIAYPDLAPGDKVLLTTRLMQTKPWFLGHFDVRAVFSRTVTAHDTVYTLDAPTGMKLSIDAKGLSGGKTEEVNGRKTWSWSFKNAEPVPLEADAVSEADFAPHLSISSYANYAEVAAAFRSVAAGRAAVTPEIEALAAGLTAGASRPRDKARILYDWVAGHTAYIAIELGTGGFTPRRAQQVLDTGFGDCKDHAVLLEAMLKAVGIESSPALIASGINTYHLPVAATPHAFDHVVTYLPAFDLFLDSSAEFAPFGVLPYADADKPALIVNSGEVMRTPMPDSTSSVIRTDGTVTVNPDGSASGRVEIAASGAYGVDVRALFGSLAPGREGDFLRLLLGANVQGTIERGTPLPPTDPYIASIVYRLPAAASPSGGDGALPEALSVRPFYYSQLTAKPLPEKRNSDYLCPSLAAEETLTITLPPGASIDSPEDRNIDAGGVRLKTAYEQKDARTLVRRISLKIDHPHATCTPSDYEDARTGLRKTVGILRERIGYRPPVTDLKTK